MLQSSLIPIEDTDPISLELGVTVSFSEGAGTDFELGDYWEFDAECWTEVTSIPIASKQFQVDYSNGMILFHSDDSGKIVYADYSGRGSIVKAADLIQVIEELDTGSSRILSTPQIGGYTIKSIYLNASKHIVIVYDETPTP